MTPARSRSSSSSDATCVASETKISIHDSPFHTQTSIAATHESPSHTQSCSVPGSQLSPSHQLDRSAIHAILTQIEPTPRGGVPEGVLVEIVTKSSGRACCMSRRTRSSSRRNCASSPAWYCAGAIGKAGTYALTSSLPPEGRGGGYRTAIRAPPARSQSASGELLAGGL